MPVAEAALGEMVGFMKKHLFPGSAEYVAPLPASGPDEVDLSSTREE